MISIIVPVYKVEAYLDQCVQSLVNQTYHDLEIILVDDGSPDNCPAMCDAWAAKDSRIRVIHKENGGLSDARNTGMAAARGEYLAFVDSDDWVDAGMYEALLARLEETDSDVASCGIRKVWQDSGKTESVDQGRGDRVLEREQAVGALIASSYLTVPVWNKLYRRCIMADILFPVGKINEDEYWSWQALGNSRRTATLERVYYNYRQRQGSIMAQSACKYPLNIVEARCQRQIFLEENMPRLADQGRLSLAYTCLYQAQLVKRQFPAGEKKELMEKIHRVLREHPVSREGLKKMSRKQKLRYWSIYHCFDTVCTLQNLLGVGI